jgi:hypothetical protein
MTFAVYEEYDYAEKNFFYTTINQNPGITIDYKAQAEPWLYDRSSAMYELYLRSGFATALREAVRSSDFYVDHLDSSGFFTLRAGDPKYAYNESLAYTYWLLGDNRMLAPISTVVTAHNGTASRWSPSSNFWTERNVGYKLLANELAYEVTGSTLFKANVQTIVNDLIWHQNGAGGQLPTNRIDGGLYHTGQQHDPSEVTDPNVIIASSWMSAFVADSMVRSYGVWQNTQIADFLVRLGNFENVASKTDANGQFGGTTRYPDYLMRADGTSENRSSTDVQHAIDVGAVAAWATYFAELRGSSDASLRQLANDLYATYDLGVNFWTRPGGTNYNVSPPRRYAWEYKNSTSFSWALTGTDSTSPQPGILQFSGTAYVVNEVDGTIAITVTRTGGSDVPVTIDYAMSNGTATAGSDYTAAASTLSFDVGETSKTFTVPIINDSVVENAESVTLALSNPTRGAALGSPATATLTINSDDTNGQPVAQNDSVQTAEDTTVMFNVLINDSDPNGDALTVANFTQPFAGVVALASGQLRYAPPTNFSGQVSFSYQASDGALLSNTATVVVTVGAVNDAPIHQVPPSQTILQDRPLVFSAANGNALNVGDVDAGSSPVQVTLSATNGTLTLASVNGLTFSTGDGAADATLTFSGALSAVNTALDGFRFDPAAGYSGAASVAITTSDQGNTGSGGALGDSDSVSITVQATSPVQQITGFDVQNGAQQRSFIRYVDVVFSDSAGLPGILAENRIRLTRNDLNGSGSSAVSLAGRTRAVGNQIELDFGSQGITGARNSAKGDGYYSLSLDLDGNGSFETVRSFYRLFGDANGDRVVNSADLAAIAAAYGSSGTNLNADVNGDGVVDSQDRNAAKKQQGQQLSAGLPIDD